MVAALECQRRGPDVHDYPPFDADADVAGGPSRETSAHAEPHEPAKAASFSLCGDDEPTLHAVHTGDSPSDLELGDTVFDLLADGFSLEEAITIATFCGSLRPCNVASDAPLGDQAGHGRKAPLLRELGRNAPPDAEAGLLAHDLVTARAEAGLLAHDLEQADGSRCAHEDLPSSGARMNASTVAQSVAVAVEPDSYAVECQVCGTATRAACSGSPAAAQFLSVSSTGAQ